MRLPIIAHCVVTLDSAQLRVKTTQHIFHMFFIYSQSGRAQSVLGHDVDYRDCSRCVPVRLHVHIVDES